MTASSQCLGVPVCGGSEVLPYRAVLLKVLSSAAGEVVETVLFLAVWLSGPIKWSGVGKEGKSNPRKETEFLLLFLELLPLVSESIGVCVRLFGVFFLQQSF